MIFDDLSDPRCWEDYLSYKRSGGHLTRKEEDALIDYVENREYTDVVSNLQNGGGFSLPEIRLINKGSSTAKRTVFLFPDKENTVMKMIAWRLQQYDGLFSDNLYSFRADYGVKKGVFSLISQKALKEMYSYKLDVSDYFNSVDVPLLLPMLRDALKDDPALFDLISGVLNEPKAVKNGQTVTIKKGIMAGMPISAFLANLYLKDLDRLFEKRGLPYARYSDDIIVFAESKDQLEDCRQTILSYLSEKHLTVNPRKEAFSAPGDVWTFLGFSYENGTVDVSQDAIQKLKKKMKRKSEALIRWKHKKNADSVRAVKAFIRYFNKKFFDNPIDSEITWCRWFFPVITTDASLKIIDAYMQECIRYIATEKRTKARYNFRYEDMKACGYKSLVHCYYQFREENPLYFA